MTPAHTEILDAVLDVILPPSGDGRLAGAGTLGVAAHLAQAIAKQPDLDLTIAPGLDAAEALARERLGRPFATLAAGERLAVVRLLETSHPAFVPTLVFHGYVGYYQHPRVVEALGLEARPPHPQGYTMAPGDLGLLEPVRRRGPLYRDV